MRLRGDAPVRDVTAVGPGDFVKVSGGEWQQILANTAHGADPLPREWAILTTRGATLGMYDSYRYAAAEDFEGRARPLNGPRYDVVIRRRGALGLLEHESALVSVPATDVTDLVQLTLKTMTPADTAELNLVRRVMPRGD